MQPSRGIVQLFIRGGVNGSEKSRWSRSRILGDAPCAASRYSMLRPVQNAPNCSRSSAVHVAQARCGNLKRIERTDYRLRARSFANFSKSHCIILANQSCSFLSSSSAEILGGEIENVFIQGDWQHVSFPFSFLQSWKSSETIVLYYIFIYIFIFIFLYFYIYIYIYLYYNFVLYLHYLYNLVLWYYIVIL